MPDSTVSPEHRVDSTGLDPVVGGGLDPDELRSHIHELKGLDHSSIELAPALIKLGTAKTEMGHHAEAEELFRQALDIGERSLGPEHPGLVPALTSLGSVRILRGTPEAAEPLFTRAVAISESQLGPDHPDLAILLNDLTRLYLKMAAYACAEPFLQQLLTIKLSKGEDHPEVATVLASLAAVRQRLGHHESAEQLWRRVLEIRERTLAPNHFALVTALEHLADACTARGKLQEALKMIRRAQAIREVTLGIDHSSLRVSRERVADLQLQASGDLLDPEDARVPVPLPDTRRLVAAERRSISVPAPPTHIRSAVMPGWNAMPVIERARPMSLTIDSDCAPFAGNTIVSEERQHEAEAVQYHDFVQTFREAMESTYEPETPGDRARAIFTSVRELLRRHRMEAISVTAVLVLLLVALASGSWASSKVEPWIAEAPVNGAPAVAVARLPETSGGRRIGSSDPLGVPGVVGGASTLELTRLSPRAIDRRGPGKGSEPKANTSTVSVPAVSRSLIRRLESVIGAVNVPVQAVADPLPLMSALSTADMPFARSTGVEPNPASLPPAAVSVPPRLIGTVPIPSYPSEISNVEGVVRVVFSVGVDGRPLMSTFSVERSTHGLFTEAVRKVIPLMRFEPAHTGGPDSKSIVDLVGISFRFALPKK